MPAVSGRLLSIYALLAAVTLVTWPNARELTGLWTDFNNLGYTHGFAFVAVSLWLIYRLRRPLQAAETQRSWIALAALGIVASGWVVFWLADIRDAYLVLYPLMLWLGVYGFFGRVIAFLVAFPIAYLYFTLPAWSWFTWPLQMLTAIAAKLLLPLSGVPAHVEGILIFIPAGVFEVSYGCSGLHFLIVGLALAALMGELNGDTIKRRAALLAIMGGLAVFTNWARVLVIVIAGHLTDMNHYLVKVDHYTFGWVLFAGAFGLFLWLAHRLPASPATVQPVAQANTPAANSSVSL